MRALLRTGSLVRRPVLAGDERLGVTVDGLLDRPLTRLVGLEVRCADGTERFLPFPACEVGADGLVVDSPLVLLDREHDFYRNGGDAFSALLGRPVAEGGGEVGALADVLLDTEGNVVRLVASAADGEIELVAGPEVAVANHDAPPPV
jgi:hypothetical protein